MRIRRRFAPLRFDKAKLRERLARLRTALPTLPRRFGVVAGAVFLGTLLAGYVFAALVLFPAPIFATSRGIPRVIGLGGDAAREALVRVGFAMVETDRVTHPSIRNGAVVWQDPPQGVVAPEGTEVRVSLSAGPQRIPVPDVAGYAATHARLLIESAGLTLGSVVSAQAPTPADVAINTRPPAGATLLPGTPITLVVSVGAATIRVPSLVGLTLEEARVVLDLAGLALGTNYARRSNDAAPGEIFFQEPASGTLSAPGTRVDVIVVSENRP